MLCLPPNSLRQFRKVLSMKCDPPSLMTILGVPNRGKMTSWNIFRVCLVSAAQHGSASIHLDTYSTATNMYSQSWDFGNGPMKSMPQTPNSSTWRLFVRGIALRVVMPPCIWHLRHLRMNSLVSSYIVGQKKPLC